MLYLLTIVYKQSVLCLYKNFKERHVMSKEYNNIIGNNLKQLRKEKGLSQKELCEELNKLGCEIKRSAYSKYESGSRRFKETLLIKLVIYYGTTADYILGLTNEKNQFFVNESDAE